MVCCFLTQCQRYDSQTTVAFQTVYIIGYFCNHFLSISEDSERLVHCAQLFATVVLAFLMILVILTLSNGGSISESESHRSRASCHLINRIQFPRLSYAIYCSNQAHNRFVPTLDTIIAFKKRPLGKFPDRTVLSLTQNGLIKLQTLSLPLRREYFSCHVSITTTEPH
jgi:hypothetical protein